MLRLDTRTAVLRLHQEGHGIRTIARAVGVSRNAVRKVLEGGHAEVPDMARDEQLAAHLERVAELHRSCGGNLVRVHEELAAEGVEVAYSTLTAFCRRHGIGVKQKQRSGRYHFEPGEEMQHDTSPHDVKVGGRTRRLQCASIVLCFSRKRFAQCFHRFNRFALKVFHTEAFQYFGGVADREMVDNSSLVILEGTGRNAVINPEMVAFARHFNYHFEAHEKGDANRSARVEGPFWHIENNFYRGRTFNSLDDLNSQLRAWCDTINHKQTRALQASPEELFAIERRALKPLPLYVPEVYAIHYRDVDDEGYVNLHVNRYSVSDGLIEHRRIEVHETKDRVRIFDGHRLDCEHVKFEFGAGKRSTLPEHRRSGRRKVTPAPPLPEEVFLRTVSPELALLVDALRARHGGRAARAVRHLHRICQDYPTPPVVQAVRRALDFGLIDPVRIETMVLQSIAGDFFRLPIDTTQYPETDDGR
jgi:transposase